MKFANLFEYLDSGPHDPNFHGLTYASCLKCRDLIYARLDFDGKLMLIDLTHEDKLYLRTLGVELSLEIEHYGTSCPRS